jgi:hypothetical protein
MVIVNNSQSVLDVSSKRLTVIPLVGQNDNFWMRVESIQGKIYLLCGLKKMRVSNRSASITISTTILG